MRISTLLAFWPALALATLDDAPAAASSQAACKVLPVDAAWPADSVWTKELKGVEKNVQGGRYKHATWRLEATKPEHVAGAVKFAKKYNIRLSILNSGHDFDGRNDAPSGLVIVTRNFKGARLLPSFTPTMKGVDPIASKTKINILPKQAGQAYLTMGVGLNIKDVTNMLAPSGLFAIGAAHKSVSIAGGWGQTAGHAPLGSVYGLGADQFVEFKVVTADGEQKVANEVSNPDLFWALRGGGGGTFGVVTEATIKVYPSPKMATSSFYLNTTSFGDKKSIWPAAAYLHSRFPELADKGMTTYYYLYDNAMSVFTTTSGDIGTKAWQDNNLYPILKKMSNMPGMNPLAIYVSGEFPDYASYFKVQYDSMNMKRDYGSMFSKRHGPGEEDNIQPRGIISDYSDSWFLGKEHCQSNKLAKALEDSFPKVRGGEYRGQMVGGGKIRSLGNDTSVLPAWREMYVHTIATGNTHPNVQPLRDLAPNMGAYANEASRKLPNWRQAFWGSNYERLSQIKTKYDPDTLFWVTPGINADAWTATDGRLCRTDAATMQQLNAAGAHAPLTDNENVYPYGEMDESSGPKFPLSFVGSWFGGK